MRAFAHQLVLAHRRKFGRASTKELLARFGISDDLAAMEQQPQFQALIAALQGALPADAVARAQRIANEGDDGEADIPDEDTRAASNAPKSVAEIDTAAVYDKWNSAKKSAS